MLLNAKVLYASFDISFDTSSCMFPYMTFAPLIICHCLTRTF